MNRFLPPSKQKLEKSRKQGDIAKSQELSSAISLLSLPAGLLLMIYLSEITGYLNSKSFVTRADFSDNNMVIFLRESAVNCLVISLLVLAVVGVVGFIAEVSQTGFLFSCKTFSLDFSRLNPGKGFRRLLGMSEDEKSSTGFPTKLYEIVKMGLYVGVGVCCSLVFSILAGYLVAVGTVAGDSTMLSQMLIALFVVFWLLCVAIFVLYGIADFFIQKSLRVARLRMDLEEFKRELKDSEGNPELKAARKQSHQQLLLHGILQGIRQAKVLITSQAKP